MRIAVIGTSNAILKGGYTFGIREHPAVTRFDNFSLGASTTVILPKVAAECDLTGYDVVLFDFAVNEEIWVRQGTATLENLRSALDGFIAGLPPETVPGIVVMPTHLGLGQRLPVHDFYRSYATARGYPLLDGFEDIDALASGREAQLELFMDPEHLQREVAHGFGGRIVEALLRWREAAPERGAEQALARRQEYRAFGPEEVENGETVERGSSLIRGRFVRIGRDGRIAFRYAEPVEIVGVGLNLAQTNGYVLIRSGSATSHAVVLPRYYKGDATSLTYVVMPVRPISGTEFEIVVHGDGPPDAVIELAAVSLNAETREVSVPRFRHAPPAAG